MAGERPKYPTLGRFIAANRAAAGLSLRQLASKAGMHHSLLNRLENDEVLSRPKVEHLQGIADALGLDVNDLLIYYGLRPQLPEPRAYFRRKLGVNAEQAEVLAQLVEDYQAQQQSKRREEEHEATND